MKKNSVWVIIVVVVVVCLVLACVAAWLLNAFFNVATVTEATSQPMPTAAANAISAPAVLGAAPVIHLAGRTDIRIPALTETSDVSLFSCRPEGLVQETFPPGYRVSAGTRFSVQAAGMVNYYAGTPEDGYPPDGDFNYGADIEPFGGISGYVGPAGALMGVFLDDAIPADNAPERLNFGADGLGTDFTQLEPALGQVFYLGDGKTSTGQTQTFVAPAGATRLFIGLIDGSAFYGASTCYTDNTGGYTYRLQADPPLAPLP